MLTAAEMLERGHRTLDWATGILNGDEGFRGAERLINGHYKATTAFMAGGRVAEARKLARHLDKTFRTDGDFHGVTDDPTNVGLRTYRNAWIARGLHVLGRYDMSVATADFLSALVDPTTGGMPMNHTTGPNEKELEWGTTGSSALAFMMMGRWQEAIRCGEFLLGMLEEQPGESGLIYLRRRAKDGKLIREVERQGLATVYSIDIGGTGQIYWYLGIAMNTFAGLLMATGEERWREGGYRLLTLMKACSEEIYESISNGKVCWGLAGMYAATRDPQFMKMALEAWAWHCAIQAPDGRWLRVGQIASLEEQPLHVTLDTSLERAFYMFELSRTLDV